MMNALRTGAHAGSDRVPADSEVVPAHAAQQQPQGASGGQMGGAAGNSNEYAPSDAAARAAMLALIPPATFGTLQPDP